MSHRVNSEGFRLGTSRFWKSELFSSYVSNFTQKFLAVYLLLKKKLNSFFFKIIFFKIIFLQGQKVLLLVNVYKVIKFITNSNRKAPLPARRSFIRKIGLKKKVAKKKIFKKKISYKQFLTSKKFPRDTSQNKGEISQRLSKGLFSLNWLSLISFNFRLERFLSKLLFCPIEVSLKNVFSLKQKCLIPKANRSVISLCRLIYKSAKNFWKLRTFLYLKDCINILSLSFFYQKSELLAGYIADIVRLRRKFLITLKSIKSLLPYFKGFYFLFYGASLKINVLGKIFGQRRRRFRCFRIQEGLNFSTQDTCVNISYSLAQAWNVFGSFGIKVWIYKSIAKNGHRL